MIQLRRFALVASCALFVVGCNQKIDVRQVHQNNGLAYKIGNNDPFSGTVTNYPVNLFALVGENGSCIVQMRNGLIDGPVSCTTEKSEKLYEANWSEGKKNGTEKVWFPQTGNIISICEWKSGHKSGLEQRYNPYINKLISEINWADDHKTGRERQWDVKGEVAVTDLNWKDGKQTGFNKSGEWDETYVGGQFDGVRRRYGARDSSAASSLLSEQQIAEQLGGGAASAVGRPGFYVALEDIWKEGKKEGVAKSWHTNGRVAEEILYKNGKRVSVRAWFDTGILQRESYYEPDNLEIPNSWAGEAARRTYDAEGKLIESMCFRDDCPELARAFPSRSQAPQSQAIPESIVAGSKAVQASDHVGQCVFPKTNIAKSGNLQLTKPILLFASLTAKEGESLKVLTAFKVQGQEGAFIQLADKDTGKTVGWSKSADFEIQELQNCNL